MRTAQQASWYLDKEVVIVYCRGKAGFEHRASEEDALPTPPAPPDGHFSFEFDESYSQSLAALHKFLTHKNILLLWYLAFLRTLILHRPGIHISVRKASYYLFNSGRRLGRKCTLSHSLE